MHVIVALARAGGKIVTRDELIEQCWDGRVVGEDAVNRALSRVRHCAAGFAGGCFAVETIPRVGYRLTTRSANAPDPHGKPVRQIRLDERCRQLGGRDQFC